ncbi:MAG TPA: hypothetical protein VFA56_03320 [Gaiellaceae bacterium]|nr:hypothetical protein [Gaiellaceae bacterium]
MLAALAAAAVLSFANPAWSPDGSRIAWTQGQGAAQQLWVSAPDGSSATAVTQPVDALGQVEWLTDDELVAFANYRIYRIRLDGTQTRIGDGVGIAVNRTHGVVAWQSADTCTFCHGPIVVTAAGATAKLGGALQNADPTISPDGGRIAFSRFAWDPKAGEYGLPRGIWTAPAGGGPLRQLTKDGVCPRWSPVGNRIVYTTRAGLYAVGGNGGRPTLLVRNALGFGCGQWSPDGKTYAYVDRAGVALLDVATRKVHRLARVVRGVGGFSWSPDSRRLVLTARPTARCATLWTAAADGGSARKLRGC